MPVFSSDVNGGGFLFSAAFQLGIPLALCRGGWDHTAKSLERAFAKNSDFELLDSADDTSFVVGERPDEDLLIRLRRGGETKPPLGWPCRVRYRNVVKDFPQLEKLGGSLHTEIWICPTGIVLVVGRVAGLEQKLTLDRFEKFVEGHYGELAVIFTRAAAIIKRVVSGTIPEYLTSKNDLEKLEKAENYLNDYSQATTTSLLETPAGAFFNDVLKDVYYVEYLPSENEESKVGYVHSRIFEDRRERGLAVYVHIGYSVFRSLCWFADFLGEKLEILENQLRGQLMGSSGRWPGFVRELKMFRVFCLRFLAESQPVRIRLRHDFMICMEKYWLATRMDANVIQISNQLDTLDKMFEWVEENRVRTRDRRIAIVAFVVSMLSISSAVATVISTVDFRNNILEVHKRIFVLLSVSAIGMLLTFFILLWPRKN
jgi:hypothetical protein